MSKQYLSTDDIKDSIESGVELLKAGYVDRGYAVLAALCDRLELDIPQTVPLMDNEPTNIVQFKVDKAAKGCVRDR